jgi:hypothetical protein
MQRTAATRFNHLLNSSFADAFGISKMGKIGLWEFPTPYAYLLYEIASDLRELSGAAVQRRLREPNLGRLSHPAISLGLWL